MCPNELENETPARYEKDGQRRKLAAKIIAPIVSFLLLLVFLLVPMYLYRVSYGIPLDGKGPEGEIWFLVIGGGLGAGVAYFAFHKILIVFGGFNEQQVHALWRGRNK